MPADILHRIREWNARALTFLQSRPSTPTEHVVAVLRAEGRIKAEHLLDDLSELVAPLFRDAVPPELAPGVLALLNNDVPRQPASWEMPERLMCLYETEVLVSELRVLAQRPGAR